MSAAALAESQRIALAITDALGGAGIFGVELFVRGDEVWFSEVSPRPHDTGLVTLISQDLSEFALHVRAILGLPVPAIRQLGPSASCAILLEGESSDIRFHCGRARTGRAGHAAAGCSASPRCAAGAAWAWRSRRPPDIEAARDKARRAAASIVSAAEMR